MPLLNGSMSRASQALTSAQVVVPACIRRVVHPARPGTVARAYLLKDSLTRVPTAIRTLASGTLFQRRVSPWRSKTNHHLKARGLLTRHLLTSREAEVLQLLSEAARQEFRMLYLAFVGLDPPRESHAELSLLTLQNLCCRVRSDPVTGAPTLYGGHRSSQTPAHYPPPHVTGWCQRVSHHHPHMSPDHFTPRNCAISRPGNEQGGYRIIFLPVVRSGIFMLGPWLRSPIGLPFRSSYSPSRFCIPAPASDCLGSCDPGRAGSRRPEAWDRLRTHSGGDLHTVMV